MSPLALSAVGTRRENLPVRSGRTPLPAAPGENVFRCLSAPSVCSRVFSQFLCVAILATAAVVLRFDVELSTCFETTFAITIVLLNIDDGYYYQRVVQTGASHLLKMPLLLTTCMNLCEPGSFRKVLHFPSNLCGFRNITFTKVWSNQVPRDEPKYALPSKVNFIPAVCSVSMSDKVVDCGWSCWPEAQVDLSATFQPQPQHFNITLR